jgi:type II secretory pathway pseudopilin PulG
MSAGNPENGVRVNHRKPRRQAGFTYLAMLFFVAITGSSLAASGMLWSDSQRRENERELLFVGNQFREAITQYKAQAGRYPARLEDLLQDGQNRRYLRRLYRDPLSNKADWGIVEAPNKGGIMGVYSLAEGQPFKTGNFAARDIEFEGAGSYAEWRFVARQ